MPERATLVLDWLLIVIDGVRGEWQVLPLPSLTLSCTGEVEVGKYQDSRCTSRFFPPWAPISFQPLPFDSALVFFQTRFPRRTRTVTKLDSSSVTIISCSSITET